MKVIFEHKSGRREPMQRRYAEVLQKLGRGTYMARDMQAAPVAIAPEPAPALSPAGDLDDLDVDALRAIADERGIKVHHRAGADKIRAALREAE